MNNFVKHTKNLQNIGLWMLQRNQDEYQDKDFIYFYWHGHCLILSYNELARKCTYAQVTDAREWRRSLIRGKSRTALALRLQTQHAAQMRI